MTELRQLLEIGAGAPPAAPDLAAFMARGRARQRRRRTLAAAAAIAAAFVVPTTAVREIVPDRLVPSWSTPPSAETGVVLPGEYTADRLTPKVRFTVPNSDAPWRVALATTSSLVVANDKAGIRISVLHWTAVRPAPSAATPTPAPVALPPDLPGWLAGHPGIRLTRPVQRVQLLGRPAKRVTFDIRADRLVPAEQPEGCACLNVTLADTPDNPFAVGSDEAAQITVVDGVPSGLVVTLVLPASGTDPDALSDAQQIVDSIAAV